MKKQLPISALLSQILVAYTVEFDNEAERRIPHRTTRHGATGAARGPWLVSMVMWFNCMQFVSGDGIPLGELRRRAHTETNLHGMHRWGYIRLDPPERSARAKPLKEEWVVRPKVWGEVARAIWEPLVGEIEERWRQRFGVEPMEEMRAGLFGLVGQLPANMPDCMPILHYGLTTASQRPGGRVKSKSESAPVLETRRDLALPVLLARVLVAFAWEYEAASHVSLAIGANVLRVIEREGALLRDLPRLGGVSKEAVAMALGFLEKSGFAEVEGKSRAKAVVLTARGVIAAAEYEQRTQAVEEHWKQRFGAEAMERLRAAAGLFMESADAAGRCLLREGMKPTAENWRSESAAPEVLPHFPMVLHRGGFPDGS